VSEPQTEFTIRVEDESTLRRVLGFCDVHRENLTLQGLVDKIVDGSIVVLPLQSDVELLNAVKVHEVLLGIINDTMPIIARTANRVSAAYRLAVDLRK